MGGLPKRFVIILAASLALNLFFFGLVAARFAWGGRGFMRDGMSGENAFLRRSGLHSAGPKAQEVLRRYRASVREGAHSLHAARAEVRAALQAEPYDAARVEKAFSDVRARTAAMQLEIHTALISLSGDLTPAQRERLADSLWFRRGGGPVP
jgi:uncharacterized membrane protein